MYPLKYKMRIILLESVTFGETGIDNKLFRAPTRVRDSELVELILGYKRVL